MQFDIQLDPSPRQVKVQVNNCSVLVEFGEIDVISYSEL